jgi:hypothetical protein
MFEETDRLELQESITNISLHVTPAASWQALPLAPQVTLRSNMQPPYYIGNFSDISVERMD